MPSEDIAELQRTLREFARERDWEQFHTPKNLAMALVAEAGELAQVFQWLTADESARVMESARDDEVEDELADVAIYLLRLADVLDVDLAEAVARKVARNRGRFPADAVRGRADAAPVEHLYQRCRVTTAPSSPPVRGFPQLTRGRSPRFNAPRHTANRSLRLNSQAMGDQ
jgi:dCTP diphosphatase